MVQACACGASWLSRGGTSVCGLTMVNILSGGRKEEEDGTQGLSRAQAAQEPATRPQEAMKANGFSSWKRRCDFGEIRGKRWLLFRLALYCCVLSESKQPSGMTSRKPETRKRMTPIAANAETKGKE